MIKEISHVAINTKDYESMQKVLTGLGLKKKFVLNTPEGQERIGSFEMPDHHFVEMFPPLSGENPVFVSDNNPSKRSFQKAVLNRDDESLEFTDPENTEWILGKSGKAQGLYEVIYDADDLRKTEEFYSLLLNMKPDIFNSQILEYKLPSSQIIRFIQSSHKRGDLNFSNDRAYHHIALVTDDIFKDARRMNDLNIPISYGPNRAGRFYSHPYEESCHLGSDGSYAFYVEDPDGNDLELMMYTPASRQLPENA